MIHERDPNQAPDADFEAGELAHLVAGNRGRMLDPRRTPVSILGVDAATGHFRLRIEAFEDRGAEWEIPLECVDRYQFERGVPRTGDAQVASLLALIERFDRPLAVSCDPAVARETEADLKRRTAETGDWLREHSVFLRSGAPLDVSVRQGPRDLAQDFTRFMEECGLREIEQGFARRWVSNPYSGELVKGHRIVLAEMGLVLFAGTIVRSESLFTGEWTRERRRLHVLSRLAFIRALFGHLGLTSVVLFRGLCTPEPPAPPRNDSFVSASFSFDVARSCTGEEEAGSIGTLYRQPVAIERVFMTYLETEALNRPFQEAEAVLLWKDGALF